MPTLIRCSLRQQAALLRSLRLRPLASAPGSAGVRTRLPVLLPDGNSGKPEPGVVVPDRRRAPIAVRRPALRAGAEPATAPEYPGRALLFVQVGAPLPHVAMHVAQPKFVRWV